MILTYDKRHPAPIVPSLLQDNLPTPVISKLYIGSLHAACNKEELLDQGIQHILNVSGELDAQFPKYFTYLSIDLRDKDYSNLLSCLPAANLFINAGMTKGGVLVHCRGGRSRSPAVVVAFLMKNRGMTFDEAYKAVRNKRGVASINKGFVRQLAAYEKYNFDIYKAQQNLLKKRVRQMAEARTDKTVSSPRRLSMSVARAPARLRFTSPGSASVNIIPPLRGMDHEFICRKCQTTLFISSSVMRHAPGDSGHSSPSSRECARVRPAVYSNLRRRTAEASPEISRARKRLSRNKRLSSHVPGDELEAIDGRSVHFETRERASSKITVFSSDDDDDDDGDDIGNKYDDAGGDGDDENGRGKMRLVDVDKKSPSCDGILTNDSNVSTLSYSGPIDDSADFDSPEEDSVESSEAKRMEKCHISVQGSACMLNERRDDGSSVRTSCNKSSSVVALPPIANAARPGREQLRLGETAASVSKASTGFHDFCPTMHSSTPSTPRRGGGGRRSGGFRNRGEAFGREGAQWTRPRESVASRLRRAEGKSSSEKPLLCRDGDRVSPVTAVCIPQLPLHMTSKGAECHLSPSSSPRGIVSVSARSTESCSSANMSFARGSPSSTPRSPGRPNTHVASPRPDYRLRTPGRVHSPETGKRCIRRWRALEESGEWAAGDRSHDLMAESVIQRDFEAAVIRCDRCFVEPMQWMGTLRERSGVLHCPNDRCGAPLGRWDWKGMRCTCGVLVSPAFVVERKSLYSRERPPTVRGSGKGSRGRRRRG